MAVSSSGPGFSAFIRNITSSNLVTATNMAYFGKCKICFVRLYDRDDDHKNNICGRCKKNGGLSQKVRHSAVNRAIERALLEDHPKTEMQNKIGETQS